MLLPGNVRAARARKRVQGLDPWSTSPDELSARLKADYDKYAQLIKLTGATIDIP